MRRYHLAEPSGIDALVVEEAEIPRPRSGEVLVRMRAAALNFRDVFIAEGHAGPLKPGGLMSLSDGTGEVVDIGEGVNNFSAGDRVAGLFFQGWTAGRLTPDRFDTALGGAIDGVLSDYRVFPESGLIRLPDHLSFIEGATLPCAGVTAWHALHRREPLQAGETVLLLGTGTVSLFALQFAKAQGLKVIITSSSDRKLEKAKALGADATINYRTSADWDGAVLDITHGQGVDLVVEVGGPATVNRHPIGTPDRRAKGTPIGPYFKRSSMNLGLRFSVRRDGVSPSRLKFGQAPRAEAVNTGRRPPHQWRVAVLRAASTARLLG